MLTYLHIKNYAIVSDLEVDYFQGLNIISGETGAGKSIALDALNYCLGSRADSKVVRSGAAKCEIIAHFDLSSLNSVQEWLRGKELNSDDECILRRVIDKDGRSRSYINGQASPLQVTRELASMLVHIHGQHDQQHLMRRECQCELLDAYANHNALLNNVKTHFQRWQDLQTALNQLKSTLGQSDRQDLLSYQINELDELALEENEITKIESEQTQLANAEDILQKCDKLRQLLNVSEDSSVIHSLTQNLQNLEQLPKSQKLSNITDCLSNALIQLEEASSALNEYVDNIEVNPQQLQHIEQRLSRIYDLARKHQVKAKDIMSVHSSLRDELSTLENSESKFHELGEKIQQAKNSYHTQAKKLSKSRQKAAKTLEKNVIPYLHQLGMPHAKFTIQFTTDPDDKPRALGAESVDFMISTNPGQGFQLLSKTASGGELSRIALAIQVVTTEVLQVPTLLFDEVDVGIGGTTAAVVGELLNRISKRAQTLCVTHQPQVAAFADTHYCVSKSTDGSLTESKVDKLSGETQVDEIARMLGGKTITKQTKAHARELLTLSMVEPETT